MFKTLDQSPLLDIRWLLLQTASTWYRSTFVPFCCPILSMYGHFSSGRLLTVSGKRHNVSMRAGGVDENPAVCAASFPESILTHSWILMGMSLSGRSSMDIEHLSLRTIGTSGESAMFQPWYD